MARPMVAESIPIKPARLILGLIACLGLIFTLFTLLFGFTSVPANSVGVKTRFGAYHDLVNPGLAYAIPYIDEIHIVPTQRLLKLEFGFTTSNSTNIYQGDMEPEETETMITGDLNTALVPWVVQYRITDPKTYFFGAREPEKTLRDLSESVMREVIGDRTVDEVLTIGRHDIESSTLKRLADLCSQYGLGLQIQQVQLATVRPPPAVQAAFNEVNQAQQEKQTAINQAWAVYNDAVPNARGQAKEREKQAEAYAFRRVNEAKGEAQKFSLLLAEYRKAPEVTRTPSLSGSNAGDSAQSAEENHRRRQLEKHSPDVAATAGRSTQSVSMNVIDVTPRPAAVSSIVRFLQSPLMSILGILFILTALKWGTLLFVVPQYETVIITRFGKIVRTVTNPGLKVETAGHR